MSKLEDVRTASKKGWGRETLTMMTGREVQGKSTSEEEAAEMEMETAEALV